MREKNGISLMWFRNDLRLSDNPAWTQAVQFGAVIPLFIIDESYLSTLGRSSRWWLTQALESLQKSLDGQLLILKGDYQKVLYEILVHQKVDALFFNDVYKPFFTQIDAEVIAYCKQHSIQINHFNGSLLWHPQENIKSDGSGYKVYGAFLKAAQKKTNLIRPLVVAPVKLQFFSVRSNYQTYNLMAPDDDLSKRLASLYEVSELAASKHLKFFIHYHLHNYGINRDIPEKNATSRLSAYLAWGQISVHQIWHQIHKEGADYASRSDVQTFLKELCWREFAYHVLFFNPKMQTKNLYAHFDNFKWQHNKKNLDAFRTAKTGYPLVDAGLQELIQTGYMHNRVRMVVASFFVKDLLIDWRLGEQFFWDLLIDADQANNSFNWQWVAGCGYDASPFFRIFNPTLQAKKFDPAGLYIKKWLPELKNLPIKYLFDPSKASASVLAQANIRLGINYPFAIVDHDVMRKVALDAYKKM